MVSLEPQNLFQKGVAQGDGRGSYMEVNCLIGIGLSSLGFNAYSAGARLNEAAEPVVATKGNPRYDDRCVSPRRIRRCGSRK